MYVWPPHDKLISWVRPHKTPPLKARKAGTTKGFGVPVYQKAILYGFRKQTQGPWLRVGRRRLRPFQRHAGRRGRHKMSQRSRTSEVRSVHSILKGYGFQGKRMTIRKRVPANSPTNVNRTANVAGGALLLAFGENPSHNRINRSEGLQTSCRRGFGQRGV